MSLATVDADGQPSVRMVLFKGFYQGAFTFYTHYEGRKARALAANPRAALVFWWDVLERQVRVEGTVQRLPVEVSRAYFHSRPRGSQIGARVSQQSRVVAQRDELDVRLAAEEARLANATEIPYPEDWGGYGLTPTSIEFWQGRRNRLHDRLVYRREASGWRIERLEP